MENTYPYENALWNCPTMDCLERLPAKSKDLIIIEANDDSSRSPNYDGYDGPLYKRVQQLHRIVSNEGIVFIESEQNDLSLVRQYMDEIFGRRCFVEQFIVPVGYYFRTDEHGETPAYKTLVGYSRKPNFELGPIERSKEEIETAFQFKDARGRYRTEKLSSIYNLSGFKSEWQGFNLPEGEFWRHNSRQLNEMQANGEIELGDDEPLKKIYLEKKDTYRHAPVLWDDIAWSKATSSKWNNGAYPKRLLKIAANEGCRVLDTWMWGQRIVDECIEAGYSYLGNVGLRRSLDLARNPQAVSTVKERYRGIIQEISKKEVDDIPYQTIRYKRLEITPEDRIFNLIAGGEIQRVEFKSAAIFNQHTGKKDKDLIDTILKVIVAFANTKEGGTLLIGVDDDGKLLDLKANEYKAANPQKEDKDGYCLYLNDRIATVTSKLILSLCTIDVLTINDADVCVIKVKPTERPVFFKGAYYRRQGTQDQKFTTEDFFQKVMLDDLEYGPN